MKNRILRFLACAFMWLQMLTALGWSVYQNPVVKQLFR